MKWLTLTLMLLLPMAGYAEEAKPISINANELMTIDQDKIALRSVINYYGASKYSFGYDEATIQAIWEVDKKLFGEKKAREQFNDIQPFNLGCLPESSILWNKIFVSMFTCMQEFIMDGAWNRNAFCKYFAPFYHGGGRATNKRGRNKNNSQYAKNFAKVWKSEISKFNRGWWNDPVILDDCDRRIIKVSSLYSSHVTFVKTLRRIENGTKKWGGIMGHESSANRQIYGNPCLPLECRDYAKGTRAYNVALQNFILKQPWWRKEFFKRYVKYRELDVDASKYVTMILRTRRELTAMLAARKKIADYDPIDVKGDVARKLK